MSSDTGLLKDICANPDDDTPRLVYADWLDDHGDAEGAEFIRLQIRLSKMPAGDRRPGQFTSKCGKRRIAPVGPFVLA